MQANCCCRENWRPPCAVPWPAIAHRRPVSCFRTRRRQAAFRPATTWATATARSIWRWSAGPRRYARVIHQLEEAGALQIGADDAGDAERIAVLVLEGHDRDRDRGAGAADDLDRQLGMGRKNGQEREEEER